MSKTTRTRRRRLQICASNQLAREPHIRQQLEQRGCLIEIEDCLDQCTRCESCAFALVNGRFLFAADSAEFLGKLQREGFRSPFGERLR